MWIVGICWLLEGIYGLEGCEMKVNRKTYSSK
jgi:hypothetical protein